MANCTDFQVTFWEGAVWAVVRPDKDRHASKMVGIDGTIFISGMFKTADEKCTTGFFNRKTGQQPGVRREAARWSKMRMANREYTPGKRSTWLAERRISEAGSAA